MTTAISEQQDKQKLIEDILKIIAGENLSLFNFKESQNISFVKQWRDNPAIYKLMELSWDNEFHFRLQEYIEKRWVPVYVGSHRWFKVRDLLRKNFLAAEKLKRK